MATTRPFSFNTGSTIDGTIQIGNLAIGVTEQDYSQNPGGVKWWMGPDEELGYVIAHEVITGDHPTQIEVDAYLAFWRSTELSDQSLLDLLNVLPITDGLSPFTDANEAKSWLNNNGFWTSYGENGIIPTPTPTPTPTGELSIGDELLIEDGNNLLLENGDNILLESNVNEPTPTSTPLPPTPTPTGGTGVGSWYFYSDEGNINAGPPVSNGNAIFTINSGGSVTETFDPNKSGGVTYLHFNVRDGIGTDYTSQFNEYTGGTGTITISQNGDTATYTSTTPGSFFIETNLGGSPFFIINTNACTQTKESNNIYVFSDSISITFGS